jgi:hypothetical protein
MPCQSESMSSVSVKAHNRSLDTNAHVHLSASWAPVRPTLASALNLREIGHVSDPSKPCHVVNLGGAQSVLYWILSLQAMARSSQAFAETPW